MTGGADVVALVAVVAALLGLVAWEARRGLPERTAGTGAWFSKK